MATQQGPSAFGVQLRRKRVAAGLTQEVLAERSRISVDAISALECGRRRRPHPRTVALLSEGLDLEPDERELLVTLARRARLPRADRDAGRAGSHRVARLLRFFSQVWQRDDRKSA
jgi:transcriptional regulator with XRE-family HTH domain